MLKVEIFFTDFVLEATTLIFAFEKFTTISNKDSQGPVVKFNICTVHLQMHLEMPFSTFIFDLKIYKVYSYVRMCVYHEYRF